jgi:hypothetical protein
LKIQGVVAHSTDRTTVTLSGSFFFSSSALAGDGGAGFCSGFLPNPNKFCRVELLGDAITARKLLRNASTLLSRTATTTTKAKSRRIAIDSPSYSVDMPPCPHWTKSKQGEQPKKPRHRKTHDVIVKIGWRMTEAGKSQTLSIWIFGKKSCRMHSKSTRMFAQFCMADGLHGRAVPTSQLKLIII